MKIVVTGGCGYVGCVLTDRLAAAGHRVTAFDLMMYERDPLRHEAQVALVRGDIRDRAAVRAVLRGVDAVVHLAFASNDPQYQLDPAIGESINLDGFGVVVDEALRAGVSRFVLASSTSVYGTRTSRCTETTPPDPKSAYAQHKCLCERRLMDASGEMTRVVLRPATVAGISPRQRFDLLFNSMAAQAFFERRIVVRHPSAVRPFVHVDDLAEVYLRALEAPAAALRDVIFNVAFEPRTVLEHAHAVAEEIPATVVASCEPSPDVRSYHVTSDRLAAAFEFAPYWTVRHTARSIGEAFVRGCFPRALQDERHHNLCVQKRMWA